MFNKRIITLIKRELKVRLMSRSFILMTILIPTFMFGIIGIQLLIHSMGKNESAKILIISDSQDILTSLETEFPRLPEVRNGKYKINYENIGRSSFNSRLNELKSKIIDESINGLVYIPSSALKKKHIEYFSVNPNNWTLFNVIKSPINKTLVSLYFKNEQMSQADIDFARDDVNISGFRITKEQKVEKGGVANLIVAILFSFLLYMSLIFAGQMTMNSVVEEKSNRIAEVLLSSASSMELMTGKILGTAIIEFLQMAIWLIPVMLLITTSWFVLPPEFTLQIKMDYILYFLVNYFVAVVTFVGLFTAVGAIFDNPQDAQSGMWPLMMLIMIPFFITLGLQDNPQSTLIRVASFFPFSSLMVMPARMTLVDVPWWQVLTSFIINIAVMISIFPVTGKVYRVGILITGKKPKWSEVAKWLKLKY